MKKISFLFLLTLLSTLTASAQTLIDSIHLTTIKQNKYNSHNASIASAIPDHLIIKRDTSDVTPDIPDHLIITDTTKVVPVIDGGEIDRVPIEIKVGDKFTLDGLHYIVISDSTCAVTYLSCGTNTGSEGTDSGSSNELAHNSFDIGGGSTNSSTNSITNTIYYETTSLIGPICIPSYVSYANTTYKIIGIEKHAFQANNLITSIEIPESCISIGDSAFYNCSGLTHINIPSKIESIFEHTFTGCTGLLAVELNSNSIASKTYNDGTAPVYIGFTLENIFGKQVTKYVIGDSVTSIGDYAFCKCSSLTEVTIPNSVTSIGKRSFFNCSGLTEVIIPNSVTSIGDLTFYGCSGLTEVTIPNSVTSIGDGAFKNCSSLKSVTIPNSVTIIGNGAFANCSGLTSVTIPNSVTTIGVSNFSGCYSLTGVTIPNSVTSIGQSAFSDCSSLTEVIIPNSVTSIGDFSFYNCSSLTEVTIPNSVTALGYRAFYGCSNLERIYVNKGTSLLLSLWNEDTTKDKCYNATTQEKLPAPSISGYINRTMTTATFTISNFYSDYIYDIKNFTYEIFEDGVVKLKDLKPNTKYQIKLTLKSNDGKTYETSMVSFTTNKMRMGISEKTITSSSIDVKIWYDHYKDDILMSQFLTLDGKSVDGNRIKVNGLKPSEEYRLTLTMVFEGNNISTITQSISTDALILVTEQPKVASPGNVVVSATSNLDNEEENVGFEWRRTDWTDEFASNKGGAYLFNGQLEGYIRNLYTEKLWKYRPYYESTSGNRYYGEWVGIDPTNTSYFEPTVHTYSVINVTGNTAIIKGYVMRGSDNITAQGFKYWSQESNAKSMTRQLAAIPSNVKTIDATGNIMTAEITDLNYETEYHYVSFVTTSEGETFYGEELTFITERGPALRGDANGDGKVDMDDATFVTKIILGTEDTTETADVNNDGIINMSDVMFIVNYIKNGKFRTRTSDN